MTSIKEILKSFFENLSQNSEVDHSRRRILKGAAGLAAAAAIGPQLLFDGKSIDGFTVSDFEKMIDKGLIENVTFYLDRTAVIQGIKNTTIRNCKFIALDGFVGESLLHLDNSSQIIIEDSNFNFQNFQGGAAIRINAVKPALTNLNFN